MGKESNKRKAKRVDCIVPVDGQEGGLFSEVRTIDFSKGGIGLVSHQEIPINEEIAIEIDMGEEQDPILVMGKVKWVTPISDSENFRIGLSFEDFLSGSKTRLGKFFSVN